MTYVLIDAMFSERQLDQLRAVSPKLKIEQVTLPNHHWPEERTTDAEVYYLMGRPPRPEQAPRLRWLHCHWAGVDRLLDEPIWDSDVTITTASGIHAPNVAQHAWAMILAWANRVPRWLAYQRKSEWPKNRWELFLQDELRDRTLGILGYGSIGREIAGLAKAFGMTVLATKRDARTMEDSGYRLPGMTAEADEPLADRIYPGEATRSMAAECDYLVIVLPLTSTTRSLVDEALLRALKPNCFLVNVGRGEIVREADLVRALQKGWIAGAGLDVFEKEPLPADSPLWQMENVIISPHVSGMTPHYDDRAVVLFAENLRRYVAGEPLLNVVRRDTGY